MDIKELKNKILFQGMTESEIGKCLSALNATKKNYKKGNIIMRAGEHTDRMGMVLDVGYWLIYGC